MGTLQEFEKAIDGELTSLWHHLHENPELSMAEFKTADYVENELRRTTKVDGIERIGKTGLWVTLRGTAPRSGGKERIIALRGDMDALPIQEETGLPYASKVPGVMHACGHDVHTTALLGSVRLLEKYRDKIPGTVWFFFQPGEETLAGALSFLDDKKIDITKVESIAGIHVGSDVDAGKVQIGDGTVLASATELRFTVTGKGAHASAPEEAVDPVVAAANLIVQLHTIVPREISPHEAAVLTVSTVHGGTKDNIIPDEVVLTGTLRTLKKEMREYFFTAIKRICDGIALSFRVKVEFKALYSSLPLVNNAACVETAKRAAKKILGEDGVAPPRGHAAMGGEDFAYFADKAPGVFIMIGSRTKGQPEPRGHTAGFVTDPDALPIGAVILSAYALEAFGVDY
jgi:amidohydrolase/hippurate hydrolase